MLVRMLMRVILFRTLNRHLRVYWALHTRLRLANCYHFYILLNILTFMFLQLLIKLFTRNLIKNEFSLYLEITSIPST